MLALDDTEKKLRDEISTLRQKIAILESSNRPQNPAPSMKNQGDNHFSDLSDMIMDGFIRTDMNGNIIEYNQVFREMIGYDDHEITSLNDHDLTPSQWHAIEAQIITEQTLKRGYSDIYEKEYVRKDTRTIPVALRNRLVRDREGNPVGMWAVIRDISEKKFSQELLEQSEGKYRTLIEHMQEGIFILRNDVIQFANTALADMLGYDQLEMMGKKVETFIAPEDRRIMKGRYRMRKIGGGSISNYEFNLLHKDGTTRITALLNAGVIEFQGRDVIMGTIRNITLYNQMKTALRASEELCSKLLAAIPDPVVRTDLQGRIVFVNDVAVQLSGYSREEITGMELTFFVVPEDRRRALYNMRIMYERTIGPMEYRIKTRNGRIMHMEVNGDILRSEDGTPYGTVQVCRNITARKKIEETLKEWEERYRLLSEASSEGVAVTDQGRFLDANRQMLDMLGYSHQEIVGRPVSDVIAPQSLDMVMKHIREGCEEPYENYLRRKDGTCFPVISRARMMLWGGKKYRVTVLRDITEIKQAEEEHKQLEAQIQQAQKMETLGTLAGGIAHDFNNLLMAIQGYTSLMLLNCHPDKPEYERLKSIQKQVKSGAELTRQLLGFARGGKYEVRTTDMNDLLYQNSEMFSRTKREITLYRKFTEDLWAADVDRGQMDQVFLNMYINSWQAMPAGGSLFIESQNVFLDEQFVLPYEIAPGRYVKISVIDTGCGMDQKTLQRVFEPFFTTKEVGRSSGLGMASAYGIVRNHGGVITAHSKKGFGTTFNVYLPASAEATHQESSPSPEILVRGTGTILVVDDDKANSDVICQMLISLGYKVINARNGTQAVEIYDKRRDIDLVILDMIMPGMSGSETFDQLKKIDPGVRVILSSGYSMTGRAKIILDRGVKAFIQKPFTAEEFSLKIRDALQK